jgi:uncharacterized protein DUF4262
MTYPQRTTRDELERIVLSNIAEFGWHCLNVIEDDGHPPWSYTIGLYETWNHPELIVIGILRLAGPFTRPCVRPAPASRARAPDSPCQASVGICERLDR